MEADEDKGKGYPEELKCHELSKMIAQSQLANEANKRQDDLLLTPEEIGGKLDLEVESEYPCSDGGRTTTVSVDALLKAQLDHAEPLIRKDERERIFEKLEANNVGLFGSYYGLKITKVDWQALKGEE